jgi:Trk K+ transport system NAD-binding subunit
MEQPFIVCGMGRIGWRVLEYLRASGSQIVVIDNRCSATDPRLARVRFVRGDCRHRSVLEEAGVTTARGVLIMTNDDLVNISTALVVRHANPGVRVVMRLFNQNLIPRLGKAISNVYALSTAKLAAPLFALSALTGQALGTIRIEGAKETVRQVVEATITPTSPFRGQAIRAVMEGRELLVLAHLPAAGKERFFTDVDADAQLVEGDRLLVCGEPADVGALLEEHGDFLPHVRWAGWLRRMGRVVWRSIAEVDLALKVCTGVLFSVILLSSLILHYSRGDALHRAFYRTISLMATAADMRVDERQAAWFSVFAGMLRVLGAALVGSFTAIVTHYLLRARFVGALELRRIPDSGHVVICGLGNIGFRVVEELLKYDERVVVIEQAKDSKFVTTTRRLGVPVLIGDATVTAVLKQAHAAQARAVIAATSEDLVNLEVALMVRELHPTQRVVLQLSDPMLAQLLREAAGVRLAMSIPLLAAPAFVAALFGDRVQSVFMVEGKLFAAIDLLIADDDTSLCDQPVRTIASRFRVLPVAVLGPRGHVEPRPLDCSLQAGSRLIAISALPDLERLLRREPTPSVAKPPIDSTVAAQTPV